MTTDAPLTFGQLSTWRSLETFPPDRLMEANLAATVDLQGLPLASVTAVMRELVSRHESLRTTYHIVDGHPVQRVHDQGWPDVECVDTDDVGDPEQVTEELRREPFSMTDDIGWRGRLVTFGGDPQFLSLSLSHMVVDRWSIQELDTQVRSIIADPGTADVPRLSPRELAALQRGQSWQGRRRRAEAYWRQVLSAGPLRNLPPAPERTEQRRVVASLRSAHLRSLAAQAAQLHSVSPQSVLVAMTTAALARAATHDRAVLSLMSENRFDRRLRPVIGTLNQLVPVACDLDRDASLATHIKRAHYRALLAYRHACYDVDRMAALADEIAASTGDRFEHDCWFNYVDGADGPPEADGPQPPAELSWPPPQRQNSGAPFYLRVVETDAMEINVRVDPDIVPVDSAVRMLRAVTLGVHRAVVEPDTPIGALYDGADAAALPTSVFPREYPPPPRG